MNRFSIGVLFLGLVATMVAADGGLLFAKDHLSIESEDEVVVDKRANTVVFKKNVTVTVKSTGTRLRANQLYLRRARGGQLEIARAEGAVNIRYFARREDGSSRNTTNGEGIAKSDSAVFDRKINVVRLKGNVRVESAAYTLTADRVEYNYTLKRGTITARPEERVHFLFLDTARRGGRKIRGGANEIRVDRSMGKLVLQGAVEVIDTSDSSVFTSDRAEIFLGSTDEVKEMIATGGFSMTQVGRVSSADRAVFNYVDETVNLLGNAFAKEDGKMEIRSSRIKMYMRVGRGFIQGAPRRPIKMRISID